MLKKYSYYASSILTLLTGIREWPLVLRTFTGLPRPARPVLHLRKSGACFQVRGPMDVWSIKETFLDEFYTKFGTPVGDGWCIVDIGAGIGEFTLYAILGHTGNTVYAFEPFPESRQLLQANMDMNRALGAHIYAEAIGGEAGQLVLNLSSGEPLKFSTETAAGGQSITVPSITLADAFKRLDIAHCDLLKLDCEGAEYAILFNAPEATLHSIQRIVMEYHDGVTPYSHEDMASFLQGQGFSVKTYENYVHADLGYLYAYRSNL